MILLLIVLIAVGIMCGPRITASIVLTLVAIGLLIGFAVLISFLNLLGGIFR